MQTAVSLTAADGYTLAATFFMPDTPPLGGVLIAGAMATPQTHYRTFAIWLAHQGYVVLTFDYRGTHASAGSRGARTAASFDTWGQLDVSAAARALHDSAPAVPLAYLGHSLGGQLFASCTEQALFGRAVPRWGLFLTTQVWGPLLTPLFGYFPGARLRKVGDLPAGVIRQWTHWCRHPDYLARDAEQRARFTAVRTPITYLNATDDEVFSDWSADRFVALFAPGTVARRIALDPQALGVARIGHFGYFRDRMRSALWPQLHQVLVA